MTDDTIRQVLEDVLRQHADYFEPLTEDEEQSGPRLHIIDGSAFDLDAMAAQLRTALPSGIPWRPIAEFDGTDGTLALVWGRWHGEVAPEVQTAPSEVTLCHWRRGQWVCHGGDFYSAWMTDVTYFATVTPPQLETRKDHAT